MHIDAKGTIAKYPALMVRDCLRKLQVRLSWDVRDLEQAACMKTGDGRAFLKALVSEGLVKSAGPAWTITQAGQRLSSATVTKPVARLTAERALREFLEKGGSG